MSFPKRRPAVTHTPQQEQARRWQAKARNQEAEYVQDWYEFHINPDRDIHGKAKKDIVKKRQQKCKYAESVDSLGQTGPRDKE
jgi:hypothetical protein